MDMNFLNNLKRSGAMCPEGAICGLLFSLLLCACSDPQSALPAPPLTEVEADLHRHIAVLAADEFEGRAPGTAGEDKTVAYLRQEFAALGLQTGNGDSWFQEVPITSVDAKPSAIVVRGPDYQRELALGEEVNVGTMQQVSQVVVQDSPLVFAGYGIVAEERGWNDYAGLDVAGKTVLVLVNDPGYASQDEALFNGNRMTYYGRWTYKYEEAARQGAEAVLVVHETGAAGYPWGVIGSPEARIGLTAENRRLGPRQGRGLDQPGHGRRITGCGRPGLSDHEGRRRQAGIQGGRSGRPDFLGHPEQYAEQQHEQERGGAHSRRQISR